MPITSTVRAAVRVGLLCSLPLFAHAQTYQRDPTFGTNGRVALDFGNSAPNYQPVASRVLPNDQILLVVSNLTDNTLMVVRLQPDGALDSGFGTGGMVTLAAAPATFSASTSTGGIRGPQVQVLPDGSVLRSGLSGNRYALLRYLPDGTVDTGFGTGGVVVPNDINLYNRFTLQPDGKIVLVGHTPSSTSAPDFYLVVKRLSAAGTTEFTTIVPHATVPNTTTVISPRGYSVLVQPDGRILAVGVGTSSGNTSNTIFTVARLLPNGNVDSSYGTNGRTDIINLPNTTVAATSDAVLQHDGKLVVAAQAASVDLIRLTTAGVLDATFGSQGQVRINSSNGNIPGTGSVPVMAAPNNGVYVMFSATAITASRLTSAGQLDASFLPANYPGSYMAEYFSASSANQSLSSTVLQQSNDRLLFIGTSATGLFPAPGPVRRAVGLLRMSAQPLAAASPQLSAQVTVFPNPARRQLWLSRPADPRPAELTLLNALGQQVVRRQVPASAGAAAQALPLPALASGVYTLRVALPGGTVTKRVVLE